MTIRCIVLASAALSLHAQQPCEATRPTATMTSKDCSKMLDYATVKTEIRVF
jgi:hypothetical protein